VRLQLVGDVAHLEGVELGERARAEAAEGVSDAVEEADLGLPRRLVPPRLAQESVGHRGEVLAAGRRLPPQQILEVDVGGPQRHVGRGVASAWMKWNEWPTFSLPRFSG